MDELFELWSGEDAGALAALFIVAGLAALYFMPAIIAFNRHHRNKGAIFALNLLAGWTFIGWVGAFVWALTN